MSLAVILSICAAVGLGLSDFLAGLYSRRFSLLSILTVASFAGIPVLLLATPLLTGPDVTRTDLLWGAISGVAGAAAILLLLQGFRVGRLSVVSPVSSLGAAGIPLVAGLLLGEQPSLVASIGLTIGLLAIWFVSSGAPDVQAGERSFSSGFWYGISAGCGLALMYLALAATNPGSGIWPVLAMQIALTVSIVLALIFRRQRFSLAPEALLGVAGIGVTGAIGMVCFLLAARAGLLSIAAVIASMSPAVTVLLARLIMSEHLSGRQVFGLVIAGVALVLISLN